MEAQGAYSFSSRLYTHPKKPSSSSSTKKGFQTVPKSSQKRRKSKPKPSTNPTHPTVSHRDNRPYDYHSNAYNPSSCFGLSRHLEHTPKMDRRLISFIKEHLSKCEAMSLNSSSPWPLPRNLEKVINRILGRYDEGIVCIGGTDLHFNLSLKVRVSFFFRLTLFFAPPPLLFLLPPFVS